jgi:hypothetical protein
MPGWGCRMHEGGIPRFELALLWMCLALSALTGLSARLASRLFHVDELPPTDPEALRIWKKRRVYMAVSEVSALPAFATAWMAAALQWNLSVPLVVLGSMASGALGFGFLIHALQTYVMRKANNA